LPEWKPLAAMAISDPLCGAHDGKYDRPTRHVRQIPATHGK
jgi:hypothetical protein